MLQIPSVLRCTETRSHCPPVLLECATHGSALNFSQYMNMGAGRWSLSVKVKLSFRSDWISHWFISGGLKNAVCRQHSWVTRASWCRGVSAYAVFAWRGFSTVFPQLPTSEFKISVKCSIFFHDVPVLTSCDFPIQWCTIRQPTDL